MLNEGGAQHPPGVLRGILHDAAKLQAGAGGRVELLDGDIHYIRRAVAKNPSTDPETVEALAADPEPRIRQMVAFRSDLPARLVEQLSRDPEAYLPGPNATVEQLRRLAGSADTGVRNMVAGHRHTPPDVLAELFSNDPQIVVRNTARSNPNTPKPSRLTGEERRRYAETHPPEPCRVCAQPSRFAVGIEVRSLDSGYFACPDHIEPDFDVGGSGCVGVWTESGWVLSNDAHTDESFPEIVDRPDTALVELADAQTAVSAAMARLNRLSAPVAPPRSPGRVRRRPRP